jgi:hypothetical protein
MYDVCTSSGPPAIVPCTVVFVKDGSYLLLLLGSDDDFCSNGEAVRDVKYYSPPIPRGSSTNGLV